VEWVNSVAISADSQRLVGGTFKYDYADGARLREHLGIFCYDGQGTELWQDYGDYWGGVFSVAISADGSVAAAGGWRDRTHGLLRAYRADPGNMGKTGKALKRMIPLDCQTITSRVSAVSLSADAKILAAAAERVYVFRRGAGGYTEVPGHPGLVLGSGVNAVAVHPSGKWLVASSKRGAVLCAELNAQGEIGKTHTWQAMATAVNRTLPNSALAPVNLNCIAIAGDSDRFAAGGADFVFVYSRREMLNLAAWDGKSPAPPFPQQLDTWNGDSPISQKRGGCADNVRWLSLSADGKRLAVIVNRRLSGDKRGMVLFYEFAPANRTWKLAWEHRLPHFPNCVSMDPKGTRIAVAYGFPEKSPGGFCMLDAKGDEQWSYATDDMNWPIAFSGNGKAIAAGGDDGNLYYFKP